MRRDCVTWGSWHPADGTVWSLKRTNTPTRFSFTRHLLPAVYPGLMGEQQEVIEELTAAGVLAGIRWAYESATRRSLESYCEADGHDPAWLGHTRFTLFRDRLDRVFTCSR